MQLTDVSLPQHQYLSHEKYRKNNKPILYRVTILFSMQVRHKKQQQKEIKRNSFVKFTEPKRDGCIETNKRRTN